MSTSIILLNKFDVVKEPTIETNYSNFSNLLYNSSQLKSDVCVYLFTDSASLKNVGFSLYYGDRWVGSDYIEDIVELFTDSAADSRKYSRSSTIDKLRKKMIEITEEYIYLNEVSRYYKGHVLPSEFKKFVLDRLKETAFYVSNDDQMWLRIKNYISNQLFLKLKYKLYYTIMDAWEKFWMVILGCVIIMFMYVTLRFMFSEKRTIGYELGSNHKIEKIIDNAADETVMDVTNLQPNEIFAILDSLNATVIKSEIGK